MQYKEYIKYGINNIKNEEVNIDGISDGVHTLKEYRDLYFKQLILLSRKKIDEIVRENLFTESPIEKLVTVVVEENRVIFNFGKQVLQVPKELEQEFIDLKNYQEEKLSHVGKYSGAI